MRGAVPGPRHCRRHHPVLGAGHPGRIGLQPGGHRAQVKRPPQPPAIALVIAGPPLPADSAPARLPLVRAGPWLPPSAAARRRPGIVLAPVHALDHRVLAAQHPCPYPGSPHAVPFPHVPVCRISDTTDGDGLPRPASAPPRPRSRLPFLAPRPSLKPPRRHPLPSPPPPPSSALPA